MLDDKRIQRVQQIEHVFLRLDARKCWMKNLLWNKFHPTPSNMIFCFFHEQLDEIGAFKRIQYFVQHCKFHMLDEMLDPLKPAFIQQTTKDSKQIKLKFISLKNKMNSEKDGIT